jgi:hypothetical protein
VSHRELTNDQKTIVKDFFEEFKDKEEAKSTFLKDLKAKVLVKYFPMMVLISKDKSGIYHDTPALQKLILQTQLLHKVTFEMVCFSDPQKAMKEIEEIKAKYA